MSEVLGPDGVRLHVEATGEGPPVLLIHGFPDSGALWRNQTGPIAEAGHTVIVPDLRGMGESDMAGDVGGYRLSAVVADMGAVLDAHGAQRAHVIGHDWGAAVAWLLASLAPDRVASLAALSVGHPAAAQPQTLEMRQKAWYTLLFCFEEAEELLSRDDFAMFRDWIGPVVDRDRYLADLARPGRLTAGLSYYRANLHPRRRLEPRGGTPPPIAVPTLGLWSTGDVYLAEEAMTRSERLVEGPWRYARIEDATHWMQLDQPERVTALLLEHLASARG